MLMLAAKCGSSYRVYKLCPIVYLIWVHSLQYNRNSLYMEKKHSYSTLFIWCVNKVRTAWKSSLCFFILHSNISRRPVVGQVRVPSSRWWCWTAQHQPWLLAVPPSSSYQLSGADTHWQPAAPSNLGWKGGRGEEKRRHQMLNCVLLLLTLCSVVKWDRQLGVNSAS